MWEIISKNFKKINLRHQKLITRAFEKNLSPLLNETIGAAVMMCLVWFGALDFEIALEMN